MRTRRLLGLVLAALALGAVNVATQQKPTLYLVATAHLDSQWNWTVQDTIREYVPKTFYTNFKFFDQYPHYVFTWEGAIHYMWFKEYHPEDWAKVQQYVANGRWRLAGSWINAVDTNMPSPESLMRQALYGQRFFRQEFGKTSLDIYLPDCFGFGFALPSIAAASGLKSFSTQKLTWGRPIPFPIGRWKGVDGSEIVAALNPHSYTSRITTDPSIDPAYADDATPIGEGGPVVFRYFGTGDTGGGPTEESVRNLEKAIANPDAKIAIKNTSADQLSRDLTPAQRAALPQYEGELILKTHGTGCYTSQAAMKKWNRQNELLADSAERASVAAEWLTGLAYPSDRLRDAWIRVLWHQFHDDLTGTCIPQAYQFSWNDELASANQFAGVLTNATSAVASMLDTSGDGVPLVVFNPLSSARRDPVEADVRFGGPAPSGVRVIDAATGELMLAQVLSASGRDARILFLADMPSVGYKVFRVSAGTPGAGRPGAGRSEDRPLRTSSSVRVTSSTLENNRLAVRIDASGDIASIVDKDAKRELLKAPVMLELRDNPSPAWPAWEVLYDTVRAPAREFVASPSVRIVERGPVRVALEITRHAAGSTFIQRVRVTEGGDRVDVQNDVDWKSPNSLLKASFPLSASNPRATYDLGVGTIQRTNNEPDKYEVPAQKWADVTDVSGSFGVGIINDSKHGWDKPTDDTLRLTLIHTPRPATSYTYQSSNDLGHHQFVFAIAGHAGDWRQGRMPARAARLNQPLVAFQSASHPGALGRSFSMLTLDDLSGQVAVTALKRAEDADEIVVRLQERYGEAARATLRVPAGIVSARELDAAEQPIAPIALPPAGGRGGQSGPRPTLAIDLKSYQPRTIALKLQPSAAGAPPPRASASIALPFNLDGISADANRADGDFDGKGQTLAAELVPSTLTLDGVTFAFGPTSAGAPNVLVPKGQTLAIPAGPFTRVYVLAAAVGGDVTATIRAGLSTQAITVRDWQGPVGQWDSRLKAPRLLREVVAPPPAAAGAVVGAGSGRLWTNQAIQDDIVVKWDPVTGAVSGMDQIRPGFVKRDEIAWIGTHRHARDGNEPYIASYAFAYAIDLPAGARAITLPNDPRLRILAVSAASEPARVRPARPLYASDLPSPVPGSADRQPPKRRPEAVKGR